MSTNQNVQKADTSRLTLDILNQLFDRNALQTVRFRLWDGTNWPDDAPKPTTIVFNYPGALRRIFRDTSSDLSIGEAYIYDDFNIEGDIYAVFPLAEYLMQQKIGLSHRLGLGLKLLQLPGGRKTEADVRQAAREQVAAIPSSAIARQLLTITMYPTISIRSSSIRTWFIPAPISKRGDEDLDTAQEQKLDYLCRKLRLQPGERLLDIGCGWGGLVIYAAQQYGVKALGITLSQPQADLANEWIRQAGLGDHCSVEVRDYRELDESKPFDKLVSVGMFEHVGQAILPVYFQKAWRLLKSGGVFLNHGIAQNVRLCPGSGIPLSMTDMFSRMVSWCRFI